MADDRVLPVEEVDGPVRPHLDVGRPKVRVSGREDRLELGAGEAGVLVLDLVAKNSLEADHVRHEEVSLELLGEMAAGEELDARAWDGCAVGRPGAGRRAYSG